MQDRTVSEVDAPPDAISGRRIPAAWRALRASVAGSAFPLVRKIIAFNLIALSLLVAGILYFNASRESLAMQEASSLVAEAELVANVFEVIPASEMRAPEIAETLETLSLRNGVEVLFFDATGQLLAKKRGVNQSAVLNVLQPDPSDSVIGAILDGVSVVGAWLEPKDAGNLPLRDQLSELVPGVLASGSLVETGLDPSGQTVFSALVPVQREGKPVAVVAVASPSGQIDSLVRRERERVLQMFVVAILVSIGLSMVLASTIANPLAALAEAAELGRERDASMAYPGRVSIPDMGDRPDEIGRLSQALRAMVSALYTRIDGNEQFAADVAHEIKNPLASLQSAVGTLRRVERDDQRGKLMDVIEHDVRRLDRLVSDISNASRLDAELVKDAAETFDLIDMLRSLVSFHADEANEAGILFVTDFPEERITVFGLQERLAQVFVNLITNALSFCEDGDAVRVWVRRRDNRILVVVEDTGPGVPDQALTKIFRRFYSQRPEEHFGNNSGLGLAISKQIVDAHGGVIWAENICPTDADVTSDPMGARFVVGLPVGSAGEHN